MLVVLAIIAMLVALAIPGINAMQKSFNSTGAEGMISAALATARTLAISHQQYAGVRFQKAGDPNNALKADQYMIFVIYDADKTGWVCGFIVVGGYKPIKLPDNVGVVDKMVRKTSTLKICGETDERSLNDTDDLNSNNKIADTSAFSILFSPAGKLVSHEIRCRRKSNKDDVFNDPLTGMFIEDNHDDSGIGVENSRREFYIYDKEKFEKMTTSSQRMAYLNGLKPVYVNPYTGELIKK
jgi:type II secretory pathway pseudopilin PulG